LEFTNELFYNLYRTQFTVEEFEYYSNLDEEEKEKDEILAFQKDAEEWYETMIQEREEEESNMSPIAFQKWLKNYNKSMTDLEKKYELYLKGYPVDYSSK
jgi:septin family protein